MPLYSSPVPSDECQSQTIRDCVFQAIAREQRVIEQLHVTMEADLDDVPSISVPDETRRAVLEFIHHLVPSACPDSIVSVTLVNGSHQWELEVAGVFQESTQGLRLFDPDSIDDRGHDLDPATNLELQRLASWCGGEVERWMCPQGGAAIVLVVPKYHFRREAA